MTLPRIDHTHDATATSWIEGANGHPDFPVQNLPFGIFSRNGLADDTAETNRATRRVWLSPLTILSLMSLNWLVPGCCL